MIPLVDLLGAGFTPNALWTASGDDGQPGGDGTQGARLAEVEAELAELRVRAQVAEASAEAAERLLRQQVEEHVGDLRRALLMLEVGTSSTVNPSPKRQQAYPPTRRVEK